MERLKRMKEALMNCVEGQVMGHMQEVDTKELGEAVDMIKDLSEAEYYCSIVQAMEKEDKEGRYYSEGRYRRGGVYPIEYYDPRYREGMIPPMYARNGGSNGGTQSNSGNGGYYNMRGYHEGRIPYEMRDPREGRSPERRRMYMEGKGIKDKHGQMQELENYMQELSQDLTEMIQDASPEEKQLLQQKIGTLASKIK